MGERTEGNPKERILEDILLRAIRLYRQPEKSDKPPREGLIIFEYGSKTLELNYDSGDDWITADTYIRTTEHEDLKIGGETTFLYEAAKKFLQQLVLEMKKTLHYELTSTNKKMIQWAQTTGKELFHWEKEEPSNTGGRKFTVTISPNV